MATVCFEGINGAGKQTQIDLFQERLTGLGVESVVFHDPGVSDGHQCQQLRKLFIYGDQWQDARVPLLIGAAARRELISEIEKSEAKHPERLIILDRFELSTFTYQTLMLEAAGHDKGPAFFMVRSLGSLIDCPPVDFLILLQTDPEVAFPRRTGGQRRRHNDESKDDQFEARGLEFSRLLYDRYAAIVSSSANDSKGSFSTYEYTARCKVCKAAHIVQVKNESPERVFDMWWNRMAEQLTQWYPIAFVQGTRGED